MSAGILIGMQAVCFGTLMIVIVSVYRDSRRELHLDLLLGGAVLLLCAASLELASQTFQWVGNSRAPGFYRTALVILSMAGGAAVVGSFFVWKPAKQNRAAALLTALIPVWLAGLGWRFARQAALFPVGETLSLLSAVFLYRSDREAALEQRAEEIERRQAMLFQWQMQPHFLFNTMSTIQELMDSDPALAAVGLNSLAGYLRSNLDALTLDRMIPFQQELEHIRQYVTLEKMNSQFEMVYDLQVIDFSVPALSIQPLVENAIRHGEHAMEGEGMVFLTTERHGDMIRVIVEDNGPGFAYDATQQQRQRASHGLENVRRRLEGQCGGTLHVHREENRTRLIVLMPRREL